MRVRTIALPLFCGLALAVVAGARPATAQTIKIGVINTYSGSEADAGAQIDKGLSLYLKEHEKDLPPGVHVELIRRDDGGPHPDVAKRLAQELVTRDHVQFLTGVVWTPNAAAIAAIATEAKVPFVITNAAGSSITRMSPYVARVSFTIWQQAYPLGKWQAQQGSKRAYIAVSDYAPGHDGEAAFTKGFTEGGGKIIGSVSFPPTTLDFIPYLQRVKLAKPDVLYIFTPAGRPSTAIMRTITDLNLRAEGVKIVATQDLVPEDELPNMGDSPMGLVTAGTWSLVAKRPSNQAFLDAWRRAYGNAIPNFIAVDSWDGMAAILDVIEETKGHFTGEQAMAILKGWKDANSPRGPIMIDPATRDIVQNVYIRRVEKVDGKLANVEFQTIPQVKDPWKELNPAQK